MRILLEQVVFFRVSPRIHHSMDRKRSDSCISIAWICTRSLDHFSIARCATRLPITSEIYPCAGTRHFFFTALQSIKPRAFGFLLAMAETSRDSTASLTHYQIPHLNEIAGSWNATNTLSRIDRLILPRKINVLKYQLGPNQPTRLSPRKAICIEESEKCVPSPAPLLPAQAPQAKATSDL